jgi:glycosyltransferase involved in cell wall biosynthesis
MNIKKNDIWIVLAAHNEASVIEKLLNELLTIFKNIVVVNDCSKDKTAEIVLNLKKIHLLSHVINLGQGAALQTGINYALRNGAKYIVTFDADGQHDAKEIMPMLRAMVKKRAVIALGSRFINSQNCSIPFLRQLILKFGIFFTLLTTRARLTDAHNGFRVLTENFAQSFEFKQNRMAHASEIISYIAINKINFIEYPVTITYTHYSVAKGQKNLDSLKIIFDLIVGRISK